MPVPNALQGNLCIGAYYNSVQFCSNMFPPILWFQNSIYSCPKFQALKVRQRYRMYLNNACSEVAGKQRYGIRYCRDYICNLFRRVKVSTLCCPANHMIRVALQREPRAPREVDREERSRRIWSNRSRWHPMGVNLAVLGLKLDRTLAHLPNLL